MNSRTLSARVKDFESLMASEDAVPVKAVRKLYKVTMELVNLVAMTESRLADAQAKVDAKPAPAPTVDVNMYAKQMKEMSEELVELKKELAELKKTKPVVKPVAPKKPTTATNSAWDHEEIIVTTSNPVHKDISYTPKKK